MRLDSFPFSRGGGPVTGVDCRLLASRFRPVFLASLPTAREVRFLSPTAFAGGTEAGQEHHFAGLARLALQTGVPQKVDDSSLLIPLSSRENEQLLALVLGLDAMVLAKASPQWLAETATAIGQEVQRRKAGTIDPATGLYGSPLFIETMAGLGDQPDLHLVLVEALPKARSPRDAFSHVRTMAGLLKAHNRWQFPLFHLGLGVFAFIVDAKERDFLNSFCLSLITALRGKGCRRAHCGSSSMVLSRPPVERRQDRRQPLIDEAWLALHTSCRRGPFAFCDYDMLINPGHFPLRPISRRVAAKVQRRCCKLENYCLVFFKPDYQLSGEKDRLIHRFFAKDRPIVGAGGYLIIKKAMGAEPAKQWAETVVDRLRLELGRQCSLSAGISCFPEHGSRKAEIVRNSQKALVHASFFGPGSIVIFDALSLNVSGDVYFGQGDWAAAVREYRRGLAWAPDEVNLLNSLGVAYAMMNRTADALASFGKVLAVDPDNFMALYNQGLGKQAVARYDEAVAAFSRAVSVHNPEEEDEAGVLGDLLYQLGTAHFQVGNYQDCIDILRTWHDRQRETRPAGSCCRYLGISYYHLGRWAEASRWLQLALVYDEFDAESLSLLGELYLLRGEGNDIALRFCEKAVEIDGRQAIFALRLGKALIAGGRHDEAIEQLRRCTAAKKTRFEAWLALGNAYRLQGKAGRARLYFKKLTTNKDVPAELQERAQAILLKRERKR